MRKVVKKAKIPAKVMYWDDERAIGNSLIVTLKYGWKFNNDHLSSEHVLGFDTKKEALTAVRDSIPCQCEECLNDS